MGIATWFAAAAVALAIARTILRRSPLSLRLEILLACVAGCGYGLLATALDFGGWNEPDWRAATFAFLGAATWLPVSRAVAARHGRASQIPRQERLNSDAVDGHKNS